MIVKILKKSATFKAVNYNTGKVDKKKGKLLLVKNFGALQAIENLRPQDYINYLEAVSSRSTRIKYPQFHVAISTKGRQHSKEELSDIAQKWMEGMGYGGQPYLLIFHKDTNNNHVHLVSTRVGTDGKKISDRYEKLKAYRVLNQIMGEDQKQQLMGHLKNALSYSFSTRAQFMMMLGSKGYTLVLKNNVYSISKNETEIGQIGLSKVDDQIHSRQEDKARIIQIRAIIEKYRHSHDPFIRYHENGYSSDLADFLSDKFGMQIVFHGKDGQQPYGYTIFDQAYKAIYKGVEIMALKDLFIPKPNHSSSTGVKKLASEKQAANFYEQSNQIPSNNGNIQPEESRAEFNGTRPTDMPNSARPFPEFDIPALNIDINITDDIDDEATLGRNRRRKRKSRTNTR
jgi:hypothetical protein